jgi:hypothetical protein
MDDDLDHYDEICASRLGDDTSTNYKRRIKKFKAFFENEIKISYNIEMVTTELINKFISFESVWKSGKNKGKMKSVSTIESNHAAIADHLIRNGNNLTLGIKKQSPKKY